MSGCISSVIRAGKLATVWRKTPSSAITGLTLSAIVSRCRLRMNSSPSSRPNAPQPAGAQCFVNEFPNHVADAFLFARRKCDHFAPIVHKEFGRIGLVRYQSRSSFHGHVSISFFALVSGAPCLFQSQCQNGLPRRAAVMQIRATHSVLDDLRASVCGKCLRKYRKDLVIGRNAAF